MKTHVKLFLIVLLSLSTNLFAQGISRHDPGPWTVFRDECDVYTTSTLEGEVTGRLEIGTSIEGTFLETEDGLEWLEISAEGQDFYICRNWLHRVHPANRQEGNLRIGSEIVNRWWGLPLDYEADDLVEVDSKYGRRGRSYTLRKPAAEAITEMFEAALAEGVDIRITSAYRSGDTQKRIYTRNVTRNPYQRSSAPPGHSEHQLGLTVDLVDPEGEYSFSREFDQTPQGKWLEENAWKYGFVRTYYPHNVEETGYISEPWHWRYYGKELAKEFRENEHHLP